MLSDAGVSSIHRLDWPSSVFCFYVCVFVFAMQIHKHMQILHILPIQIPMCLLSPPSDLPASLASFRANGTPCFAHCTMYIGLQLKLAGKSANYRNTQYKYISQENTTDCALSNSTPLKKQTSFVQSSSISAKSIVLFCRCRNT